MTREALEALAARCEQATGPDAYADYLIHAQVRGWRTPDELNCFSWCVGENYQYGDPNDERHAIYISESDLPNYTASVDAALTLVPEGWRVGFEDNASCDEPGKVYAWVWPFESPYDPDWQMGQEGQQSNPDALKGYASTRALAITAAALRAHATKEEE